MVLAERNSEMMRNGRRSRGPSPNGHGGSPDSSSDEDNSIKKNGSKSKSKQSEYEEKIRVGRDYQAVCPDLIPSVERKPELLNDRALLVWSPTKDIPDNKLEEYISVAKEKYGYNGEQALGMLFWHKHDLERAVMDLANFTPFPDEWTVEDKVLFEQAFQFHGKSFHRIRQMLPDKSIASLVKYYYSWKKTRHRQSVMDRQEKAKVKDGSENGSENGSNEDSDSEEKDQMSMSVPVQDSMKTLAGGGNDTTSNKNNKSNNIPISSSSGSGGGNAVINSKRQLQNTAAGQQQHQQARSSSPSTSATAASSNSSGIISSTSTSSGALNAGMNNNNCNNNNSNNNNNNCPNSNKNIINNNDCNMLNTTSNNNSSSSLSGCCAGCGVSCNHLNSTPHGKLCNSCYQHWRRTGTKRPTTGPYFGKRYRDRNADRHKRKPPRGMHINHDDIVALASSNNNQDELLANTEREIISLLSQVQQNKQTISALKRKNSDSSEELRPQENLNRINSRWNNEELLLAVNGVRKFGKDFQAIADTIGTKTEAHVRTFFVNYRRRYNLDNVLKEYEAEKAQQEAAQRQLQQEQQQQESEQNLQEKQEQDQIVKNESENTTSAGATGNNNVDSITISPINNEQQQKLQNSQQPSTQENLIMEIDLDNEISSDMPPSPVKKPAIGLLAPDLAKANV